MEANHNYYSWLVENISHGPYDIGCYQLILERLHQVEFYPIIPMDENRRQDGLSLKRRYDKYINIPFDGPYSNTDESFCSVLEMMVAFAMRIEDDIMYDPEYGNRTSEWFWTMMENLYLTGFDDDSYDDYEVDRILHTFLQRLYGADGYGGLFYTHDVSIDMRDLELWDQCSVYLNEFVFQ